MGISALADWMSTGGSVLETGTSEAGSWPAAGLGLPASPSMLVSRIGSPGVSSAVIRPAPELAAATVTAPAPAPVLVPGPLVRPARVAERLAGPVEPARSATTASDSGRAGANPFRRCQPTIQADRVGNGRVRGGAQAALGLLDPPLELLPLGRGQLLLAALGIAEELQCAFILLVLEVIQAVAQQVPRRACRRPRTGTTGPSTRPTRRNRPRRVPGLGDCWAQTIEAVSPNPSVPVIHADVLRRTPRLLTSARFARPSGQWSVVSGQ